jgi:abortive infection bacteriophage resistance protein
LASYQKPYLTTEQQLALLKSRGMIVSNDAKASASLSRIGYYRLSAYWYPNRKSETYTDPSAGVEKMRVLDDFRDNTSFADALDFYVYDKKLRLLVLDALERVEVGLRTDIALTLGLQGAWAHRDPGALHGKFTRLNVSLDRFRQINDLNQQGRSEFDIAEIVGVNISTVRFVLNKPHEAQKSKFSEWLSRLDKKFKKAESKEDFANHFANRYPNDKPPIWVAVEVWDFGTMSHFFSGMKISDRNTIAAKYGLLSGDVLESWLRNLNDVRNFCAHHSRLWNRNMSYIPAWPKVGAVPQLDHVGIPTLSRFYASAVILQHLLKVINPSSSWSLRLFRLVTTLPVNPYVTLASAGFPENWTEQEIWNENSA